MLSAGVLSLVPEAGVEPARYRYHRILSPARLPIPSFRHMQNGVCRAANTLLKQYTLFNVKMQHFFFAKDGFLGRYPAVFPPVAQLDNAADSDSEERGFESLPAGQIKNVPKPRISAV